MIRAGYVEEALREAAISGTPGLPWPKAGSSRISHNACGQTEALASRHARPRCARGAHRDNVATGAAQGQQPRGLTDR